MGSQGSQESVDRRGFLRAVAATAAAAAGVGSGAAILMRRGQQAPVTMTVDGPPPLPVVSAAETATTASGEAAELLSRLASAQAENMRLRAELDAAQRRLGAMETANGDTGQENELLQEELAAANNRVNVLAGLVGLYEQLEDVNLLETIDEGIGSFGETISGLVESLPSLEGGIAAGRQALDNLETEIPLVKGGRTWMEGHLERLRLFYEASERVLDAAVETAGSFLEKLNEWFQNLRKWLPFGVGDTAADVMHALTDLVTETPNTIHGLRRNVADPLDLWLDGEGEELPLRKKLVKPIKEQALDPAGAVVTRARETESAYHQKLVEPVQEGIKSRRLVKEEIRAYRKKHNLQVS